jgi:ABC-type protease/lipase transport system fused ATPase/permease subunit
VTAPNRTDPLIDRLELDVPPGTLLIVTGANGVGKSTLLRTLIGLRPPAGGQVLLDGQDLHRTPRHEVGPRIGFLGQRAQLLDASVMANISRFTGRGAEAVEAARLVGAHEMIGRLAQGYNAPAGPASGLSGGQQRLIALARACFGTPRLVVLDEPEAGLDPNAVGALHRAAAELRQRGCVVVVVTHAAKGWNEIADQELRLAQDGRWACGWLREPSVTGA